MHFRSADGLYEINWPEVWRICSACARSRLIRNTMVWEWDRPRGFIEKSFVPHIHTVYIDWKLVNANRQAAAEQLLFREFFPVAQKSMQHGLQKLYAWEEETRRNHEQVVGFQRLAHLETMRELAQKQAKADGAVEALKFIRDRSADFVVIGAGVLTGGSAAAIYGLMAGGATLKGVGAYQDGASLGYAIFKGASTFAFGAVGRGVSHLSGPTGLNAFETAWVEFIFMAPAKTLTGLAGTVLLEPADIFKSGIDGASNFASILPNYAVDSLPKALGPIAIPVKMAITYAFDQTVIAVDEIWKSSGTEPQPASPPKVFPPPPPLAMAGPVLGGGHGRIARRVQ